MNGTPRLRSAYPSSPLRSPQKDQSLSQAREPKPIALSPSNGGGQTSAVGSDSSAPLIPLSLLDAPTQRLYVVAFYVALVAWRLVDYTLLVSNDTDSPWQWMKWTAIDGAFLFGVPELRIPWLEWSSTTMTVLFLFHAVINGVLMFRIPIPLEAWVLALTRVVYDRELSVSERKVKPATLFQHSSLITGKQIVHILPEGSAMLNPHHLPLCIDRTRATAEIPIFINQTNPISIELFRIDLDTNTNETIQISVKEARKMKKQADREAKTQDTSEPRILRYPVKKTGIYRLTKVLDESKLEVHRLASDTLVVPCPHGLVKSESLNKCHGDLSSFNFLVTAVPPLKIKYRKTINDEASSNVQLTVHPDNLDSPLARSGTNQALTKIDSHSTDLSWARAYQINIPVNETFGIDGSWRYFLEEIRDGCGNVVNYTRFDDNQIRRQGNGMGLEQIFQVHSRPKIAFEGCSAQKPLKIAKGKKGRLPVQVNPSRHHSTENIHHLISYSFMPQQDDIESGESGAMVKVEKVTIGPRDRGPEISEPGLYRLETVATEFCSGEVLEPSSCLLSNPPEPDLSISSDKIPHQCAGNSVGLRVDLDMIGTPPYEVRYTIKRGEERAVEKVERVTGMRTQLEFRPQEAGFYSYEFVSIMDSVYRTPRSLRHKQLRLEQDVKPTAIARFIGNTRARACIEASATFQIQLTGEAPWTLDYDLIHQGRRTKHQEKDIQHSPHMLVTSKLIKGGQYSVSLTSITDASGCKIFLDQEASVDVRHQRPSVSFGQIEGKASVLTLEGKKVSIPLRLSGESPWTVSFSRLLPDGSKESSLRSQKLESENDQLRVDSDGAYVLESVSDGLCPGVVEPKSRHFEIKWISRPSIQLVGGTSESLSNSHTRTSVCEGDQDAMELSFAGTPPFYLKYEIGKTDLRGQKSISHKEESIGSQAATIAMDTQLAGLYIYEVTELGDQLYDHDRQRFSPMIVKQQVNSLPTASFANLGKTYSYCKEDTMQDERIPIKLVGAPPFSLEIGIRHHSSSKPDVIPVPHINTNQYEFHIPHRALSLGSHVVSIRKVSDANGCRRTMDYDGPEVRVNVVDVPNISPMEQTLDFCVGDRISYTLAGTPPFNIYYTFEGIERKASTSTNSFRRIAERPGNFTITAVSDKTSTDACRARTDFTKTIHELPSVHMSKGKTSQIDIHEGGEAELSFEFGGTPPFEFTYTRSTNSAKGKPAKILETRTEVSTEFIKTIRVSEEGTYEVVSVRDRFCAVSTQRKKGSSSNLLTFN